MKHFFHAVWLLFVAVLLLTAIGLTAARLWLPSLAGYQNLIETSAGELLDRQVTIGRLEVTLHGLVPTLKLKQVGILDPATGQQLDIDEIWLGVDVEHYFNEQELRLSGIDVVGADLTVVRDAEGHIYIEKLRYEEAGDFDISAIQRFSVHKSIVTVNDQLTGEPARRFREVALSLYNQGSQRRVTGHALLPPELGQRVDIEAGFRGDLDKPAQWQGMFYVKGQLLDLSTLLGRALPDRLDVNGQGDARLWLGFANETVEFVSGELDIHDFRLLDRAPDGQVYQFDADALGGQFGWKASPQEWQFAIQNFRVERQQQAWQTENLSLSGTQQADADYYKGVSSRINLDGLSALLPVIPGLDTRQREQLAALSPRGVIKDLEFSIRKTDAVTELTGFNARFAGLGIEQTDGLPSFEGLDGAISGTLQSGVLTLDTRKAGIQNNALFRDVLPVNTARGAIHWWQSDGRVEIASEDLIIENDDFLLETRFGVDIPAEGSASINLAINIKQAQLGRVAYYLPAKVMSATGVAWLDRSLVSGTITNGMVVVNGRFDQIPFDKGEGILEVSLPVTDAVLDFNEHWTPIKQLDALVVFSGRQMGVITTQGKIRSAALHQIHARIKDLKRPDLTIKGAVQGELPVMLAELGSSPLGKTYGGFVDRVTTTGNAQLDLDLQVYLSKKSKPVDVSGLITLKGNDLRIKDSTVALNDIDGQLAFDEKGIRGDVLKASLFGQHGKARVWSLPGDGGTRISLEGRFGLLQELLPKGSAIATAIKGNSNWKVLLSLRGIPRRGEKANVGLELSTDLVGTTVALPEPLGKQADDVRKFSIAADRIDFPEKELSFNYADRLQGLLQFRSDGKDYELLRGNVRLGPGKPVMPDAEMLSIAVVQDRLRLADWQSQLGGGTALSLPVEFDLELGELQVMGHSVKDVTAHMAQSGRVWNISASGPSAEGEIHLTQGEQGVEKVVMSMKKLMLESLEEEPSAESDRIDPADFPELQISAQQLVYDDADFGVFELQASKTPAGSLDINRLAVSSELLFLQGSGQWQGKGERQTSNMEVEITDGKMDELMEIFGYQESIENGELSGTMNAAWPGAPWAFSPSAVEGKFKVKIEDGQLLDVEPGAAGRVLGLLSLTNLPRRLVLDFSDLFGEGFGFDVIEGSFVLENGNAYTNDLIVDGPSARIEITGRVGIADRDYDEQVTVTPYVKTGVSLVGTLVGGPAVGAALMVVESLMEKQSGPLNRIARKQYSVTGSWDDPVITKLKSKQVEEPEEAVTETE